MKKMCSALGAALIALCLTACSVSDGGSVQTGTSSAADPSGGSSQTSTSAAVTMPQTSETAPSAAVSGGYSGEADKVIELAGESLSITSGGTYVIRGTLADGQIYVESSDANKVKLILDGVDISCSTSAAIFVRNAEKTLIELAEGSVNILSGGIDADEGDAAVYSKDDIKFKGTGTLYIQSDLRGIHCTNDIQIEECTLIVVAGDDGIRGKDSVQIASGSVTVTAGADGIRSNNEEEEGRGYITVEGGSIYISSALDGIQAAVSLSISGGDIAILTGGGSANSLSQAQTQWSGGMGGRPGMGGQSSSQDLDYSAKGLKAGGSIDISGGSLAIDSIDDAVHSNGTVAVSGGSLSISTGDDGVHADADVTVSGGTISIAKSYEGIEGLNIYIQGGEITLTASDDGLNGAGGNDGSSMGGRPGQNGFSSGNSNIVISGGTVVINASGDGIDVNGSLSQSGGHVTVYGPTDNGNGALDYDGSFVITGGYIAAFGSTGMAQGSSSGSTQANLFVSLTASAGSRLLITDASGTALLDETPPKAYGCIFFSSPDIASGGTYTFTLDGSELGSLTAK